MSIYSLVHQGSQGQYITTAIFVRGLATNFANVNETLWGIVVLFYMDTYCSKVINVCHFCRYFHNNTANVNNLQFTLFLHLARDHYYVYLGHYVPLQMLLKAVENFGHS